MYFCVLNKVTTMNLPENIIVAATQNRHKIREMEAITARFGMQILGRDAAGVPDVEIVEDGKTFEENSYKKAFGIMQICGKTTIADDSGLEVDCLCGAPGIYSARFAEMEGYPWPEEKAAITPRAGAQLGECPGDDDGSKEPSAGAQREEERSETDPDKDNNRKLIRLIRDVPYEKRTGRFVSVITMVFPDGKVIAARGTVEGHILLEERGEGGFGYDPLFVPDGYDETFGQLPAELKNRISHRANALKKLEELLRAEQAQDDR